MARVALCQDVMVEYMGFMCISAVLKQAGHTVELFFDDGLRPEKFLREVSRFNPDVIGFSVLTPSLPWALERARELKKRTHAVTVFGNVHIILQPETIEYDGVDIVCLGEGENCMRELCDALDRGEDYSGIHGFWVKTPEGIRKNPMRQDLVDMNTAPYIDRALYNKYFYFRHSHYLKIITGRGCPFRCTFCTNPSLADRFGGFKSYHRKKTPENAIREIEYLIRTHPVKVNYIYFIDEVFWVKNEWLREFLTLYKERIGLPFAAYFRFGAVSEEEIKLMAEAGIDAIYVATETGNEDLRRGLLNKPVKNEHVIQVTDWMHKYGVPFGTSEFFGLPGQTVEEHVKDLEFFDRVKPEYIWTTFFQPYPGIALNMNHEVIKPYIKDGQQFGLTLHHDMYLDLPDRDRLVNLKKVYFLMYFFPRLRPLFLKLINYNIPFLFDFLFMTHFTWYVFRVEKLGFLQFLVQLRTFALNPLLRKKQPLQHSGRPFSIRWRKKALKELTRQQREQEKLSA